MQLFIKMFCLTFTFLFSFSAASQDYQAAWSCGKSLGDSIWTINSEGVITKDDDDDNVEVYGLVGNDKMKLIRMIDENINKEQFEMASSIMEQMQWKKRGNTYLGNGVLTLAELVFGITMTINDEQSVSTMVIVGSPDMVAMVAVEACERLY